MPIKQYTPEQKLELKIRRENIKIAEKDLGDMKAELDKRQDLYSDSKQSINKRKSDIVIQEERLRLAQEDHRKFLFRIGNS